MNRLGVVGCGVMGAGIAEVGAKAGCDVVVVDAFADALDKAKARMAASLAKAEAAGNDILRLCVDAGGCLTGEHGVGIEKRDLMRYQYSETDLAQQMAVRAAFDPDWILNPSKVFPLDGRNAA